MNGQVHFQTSSCKSKMPSTANTKSHLSILAVFMFSEKGNVIRNLIGYES